MGWKEDDDHDYYYGSKEWSEEELERLIESRVTRSDIVDNYLQARFEELIEDWEYRKELARRSEPVPTKMTSLPMQIALLFEIGFFELDIFKKLNATQKENLISVILNRTDKRGIRGNINVLNEGSEEDALKYTSHKKIDEAKEILKNL